MYARNDMWDQAKCIFDKFPDMVRIPLTANCGETALHVAVSANSATFVEGLVQNLIMTTQDLDNQHFAFIQKRDDDMLPVHLAALAGHHKILQDLCSKFLLHKMTFNDIQRLFFMTINSSMFGKSTTKYNMGYPFFLYI